MCIQIRSGPCKVTAVNARTPWSIASDFVYFRKLLVALKLEPYECEWKKDNQLVFLKVLPMQHQLKLYLAICLLDAWTCIQAYVIQ